MSFEALRFDRETWIYFEFTDSMEDSLYLLAVAKTTSPKDAHREFLRERFTSNEFLPSRPTEIVSRLSRSFLAECLSVAAAAIERDWTERPEFWREVRETISRHDPNCPPLHKPDLTTKRGRVLLLEFYLAAVMVSKRRAG